MPSPLRCSIVGSVLSFPVIHIFEKVRNLRPINVAHRLLNGERQFRLHKVSESARRCDPLAGQVAVFENLQCVSEVRGEFVDALLFARIRILHRRRTDLVKRSSGFEIDDPRVRDHFRVDVPVRQHQIPDQFETALQFAS